MPALPGLLAPRTVLKGLYGSGKPLAAAPRVICLLFAVLAAVLPTMGTLSPETAQVSAVDTATASTNSAPAEELQKVLGVDAAAEAEVERWLREAGLTDPGAAHEEIPNTELRQRCARRFEPVRQAYQDFLTRHPRYVPGLLAYGSFLQAREEETGAQVQWEKVLAIDPANADAHHNLACRYTETGPVKKAFEFFDKAIELNSSQPVFFYNFANALYVLRAQGTTHYRISEQEVCAKVIVLYSNAVRLDPTNLAYATDLAQTYYAMRPFPAEDALKAWNQVLPKAVTPKEREEIFVHLARAQMLAGHLEVARAQLKQVTNASLSNLKSNLFRAIALREGEQVTPTELPAAGRSN